MIVAWHEVPGSAPPRKSRPVGYGMIRVGMLTDSKIGGENFECGIAKQKWKWSLNAFQEGYLAFLKKRDAYFDVKYLRDQLRPIIRYPPGRFFAGTLSQALRARLRSGCPSGTKRFRAEALIKLALMG